MQHEKKSRKKKSAREAPVRDEAATINGLANDFLDLWQENLLAWASDPTLSPGLPAKAAAPARTRKEAPPHDP